MTLVSQLIADAYRQSNLLALGTEPTAAQQEEALRYLDRIFQSVIGNEATNLPEDFPLDALTLEAEFPFPKNFDDMFITMLAMRLNPAYGVSLDQQAMFHFNRSRTQFRAKYQSTTEVGSELGLIRHSKMERGRDGYWNGDSDFTLGYPLI